MEISKNQTLKNYIAILQEDQLSISVPIIKIDEPFFNYICNIQQPQTILFTNPATVEVTVERLKHYDDNHQKSLDLEVIVINNTFDLIMQGLKEEYNQEISKFSNQIIKDEKKLSLLLNYQWLMLLSKLSIKHPIEYISIFHS